MNADAADDDDEGSCGTREGEKVTPSAGVMSVAELNKRYFIE